MAEKLFSPRSVVVIKICCKLLWNHLCSKSHPQEGITSSTTLPDPGLQTRGPVETIMSRIRVPAAQKRLRTMGEQWKQQNCCDIVVVLHTFPILQPTQGLCWIFNIFITRAWCFYNSNCLEFSISQVFGCLRARNTRSTKIVVIVVNLENPRFGAEDGPRRNGTPPCATVWLLTRLESDSSE